MPGLYRTQTPPRSCIPAPPPLGVQPPAPPHIARQPWLHASAAMAHCPHTVSLVSCTHTMSALDFMTCHQYLLRDVTFIDATLSGPGCGWTPPHLRSRRPAHSPVGWWGISSSVHVAAGSATNAHRSIMLLPCLACPRHRRPPDRSVAPSTALAVPGPAPCCPVPAAAPAQDEF